MFACGHSFAMLTLLLIPILIFVYIILFTASFTKCFWQYQCLNEDVGSHVNISYRAHLWNLSGAVLIVHSTARCSKEKSLCSTLMLCPAATSHEQLGSMQKQTNMLNNCGLTTSPARSKDVFRHVALLLWSVSGTKWLKCCISCLIQFSFTQEKNPRQPKYINKSHLRTLTLLIGQKCRCGARKS